MMIEIPAPTLIAEGTSLQGSLTFVSTTQVFGMIEGQIAQQSLEPLQVGKQGWVNGSILSRGPILIEGRVDGDIISDTRIRLFSTAIVRGSLIAPSIEIRAGAAFEGEIKMANRHEEIVRTDITPGVAA